MMREPIHTERLFISPLTMNDAVFIQELVNTKGWIEFIGQRNVHSKEDAEKYIQRITTNDNIIYWTVRETAGNEPLGIITYIKRDYLPYNDIGFAFLPAHAGKGYAFEAAGAVLKHIISHAHPEYILATTFPANVKSIRLLNRLGLEFQKEIQNEGNALHVYSASAEKILNGE